MNAIKIMGAALLLLFVLNLISLILLLRIDQSRNQIRPVRPGAAAEFLMQELQFNAAQRRFYTQLIEQHQEKTRNLEQRRVALRQHLFAGIALNDTSAIEGLRQVEGDFERLTFQHFRAVHHMATAEQRRRFDRVIQEAVGRMATGTPPRLKKNTH